MKGERNQQGAVRRVKTNVRPRPQPLAAFYRDPHEHVWSPLIVVSCVRAGVTAKLRCVCVLSLYVGAFAQDMCHDTLEQRQSLMHLITRECKVEHDMSALLGARCFDSSSVAA